ncbi:PadR family transcriptional regulator [Bryobacterales bacterium F-183]|nr:PadR family transcriptional regulator [Bryobacterales bacterium F-183]
MPQPDLLPGTLDLLVLKTISRGALHGYGIAQYLLQISDSVLQVGEGSLYPALQRLLVNGWAEAEWRQSETGRRARYYTITAAGKKRLAAEEEQFEKMVGAIHMVLRGRTV